jgi:glycosyltransferase involved in cell wall biosynthesis
MPPGVFAVVPAYNEARVIGNVIARLRMVCPNIVVVDDASGDGTAAALAGAGVYVLRHAVNRGQGAALQTGITFALLKGAEIVVTFDADGQHDENDIRALIEPVLQNICDVALGSRFLGRADEIPPARRLLLKAGVLFTRIFSRMRLTDVHNGLRAFSRNAAAALHIHMDRMAHASEILEQIHAGGWSYIEVPVTIRYSDYSRAKGQSSWNALTIGSQLLLRKLSR